MDGIVLALADAITKNDLDKFFDKLKSYFAGISYDLQDRQNLNEQYYHSCTIDRMLYVNK